MLNESGAYLALKANATTQEDWHRVLSGPKRPRHKYHQPKHAKPDVQGRLVLAACFVLVWVAGPLLTYIKH